MERLEGEAVKAFCYIEKWGNERNKCIISDNYLGVVVRGRKTIFPLADVSTIFSTQKKMLFPLVLGGIVAPFCLLAIWNQFFDPWLMLTFFIGGLYMAYYGWMGSCTLTIKTKLKEYDFFVNRVTSNLKAFMTYVNDSLPQYAHGEEARKFYLRLRKEDWIKATEKGKISIRGSKQKLYTFRQERSAPEPPGFITLVVDPDKVPGEMRFLREQEDEEMFPYLFEDIPLSAVKEKAVPKN